MEFLLLGEGCFKFKSNLEILEKSAWGKVSLFSGLINCFANGKCNKKILAGNHCVIYFPR